MAVLLVFVCAFSLANGYRIQPPARISSERQGKVQQTQPEQAAPAVANAPAANATAQTPGAQQQTAFPSFANVASMLEEKVDVLTHPKDSSASQDHGSIFDKVKTAMYYNAQDGMRLAEHYFSSAPRPVMGVVLGSFMISLTCFVVCCAQCLASILPRRRNRYKHMHEGRVVYEWDQTPKMATIYIRPPEGVTKNDLDIKIACRHLRVGRKGKPSFLREETYDVVNEEMSSWSLRTNGELQIYLQKVRRAEWPTILLHNKKFGFPTPSLNTKLKLPLSWTRQQDQQNSGA